MKKKHFLRSPGPIGLKFVMRHQGNEGLKLGKMISDGPHNRSKPDFSIHLLGARHSSIDSQPRVFSRLGWNLEFLVDWAGTLLR